MRTAHHPPAGSVAVRADPNRLLLHLCTFASEQMRAIYARAALMDCEAQADLVPELCRWREVHGRAVRALDRFNPPMTDEEMPI